MSAAIKGVIMFAAELCPGFDLRADLPLASFWALLPPVYNVVQCHHVADTKSSVARSVCLRLCSGPISNAGLVCRSGTRTQYRIRPGDAGRTAAAACTGRTPSRVEKFYRPEQRRGFRTH